MKLALPLLALSSLVGCVSRSYNFNAQPKFTATNSIEAKLEFEGVVHFASPSRPDEQLALEEINEQLIYLVGPMSHSSQPAMPRGDHRLTNIQIEALPETNTYAVHYKFSGTAQVLKTVGNEMPVILPRDLGRIYEAAYHNNQTRCTHYYDNRETFWYYWDPSLSGCPLKENQDYLKIKAKVTRLESSTLTYPEFNRLSDDGVVTVGLFLGLNDARGPWEPERTTDIFGYHHAYQILPRLKQLGFVSKQRWNEEDFKQLLARHKTPPPSINELKHPSTGELPYVAVYEKAFPNSPQYKAIRVRVYFGPTGRHDRNTAFHYLYKESVERDSVMIYEGHSGLGSNLDLHTLQQTNKFNIKLDPNKYQIFYFNSCVSYRYYNKSYFKKKRSSTDKRGTKNLDIFANGLGTADITLAFADAAIAVVASLDHWASTKHATSYQELAQMIDKNYLFSVSGDEDNPSSM